MASRRLLSSSLSLPRRLQPNCYSSALSCLTFPSSQTENNQQNPLHIQHSLLQVRLYSAIDSKEDKKATYGDRARAGARKGATAARKGAIGAKDMMRQYGPVFVGTYVSLYFLTWGALFAGIDSGAIDPLSIMGWISGGMEESKSTVHVVVEYMEKYDFTKPYAVIVEENPHIANLGVAWVATKFTEPLRLMVAIGIVPKLARHFGFVDVKEVEGLKDENVTAADADATEADDKAEADEQAPAEESEKRKAD